MNVVHGGITTDKDGYVIKHKDIADPEKDDKLKNPEEWDQ